jgi:hypothetical protein
MGLHSFGNVTILSSTRISFETNEDNGVPTVGDGVPLLFDGDQLPSFLSKNKIYFTKNVRHETTADVVDEHTLATTVCDLVDYENNHILGQQKTDLSFSVRIATSFDTWADHINVAGGSRFEVSNNPYKNYDTVAFFSSGELPYPLVEGEIYSVINVEGNSFQLAETTGGYAIVLEGSGTGVQFVKTAFVPLRFGKSTGQFSTLATYTPLVTPVRASHLQSLRTRINNELIRRGKPAFTFIVDPALTVNATHVKASQIYELRNAASGITATVPPFTTDPVLTPGITKIRAIHFQEIDDFLTVEEAKVKTLCTHSYTTASSWTAPSNLALDSVCVWGIGGGGGGGKGGNGGTGQPGGHGGTGGTGGPSGLSGSGGNGGKGGLSEALHAWGDNIISAIGGGGGGGGGSGTPGYCGLPGGGGGRGAAGAAGGTGAAGTVGSVGSGNIASYPASPCVISVSSGQVLNISIGAGGGQAAAGSATTVKRSTTTLFTAGGGSGGTNGGNGGNASTTRAATGGTPETPNATSDGTAGKNGSNGGDSIGPQVSGTTYCSKGGCGGSGGADGYNSGATGGGAGGGGGASIRLFSWAGGKISCARGGSGGAGYWPTSRKSKVGGSGGGAAADGHYGGAAGYGYSLYGNLGNAHDCYAPYSPSVSHSSGVYGGYGGYARICNATGSCNASAGGGSSGSGSCVTLGTSSICPTLNAGALGIAGCTAGIGGVGAAGNCGWYGYGCSGCSGCGGRGAPGGCGAAGGYGGYGAYSSIGRYGCRGGSANNVIWSSNQSVDGNSGRVASSGYRNDGYGGYGGGVGGDAGTAGTGGSYSSGSSGYARISYYVFE